MVTERSKLSPSIRLEVVVLHLGNFVVLLLWHSLNLA
jgi:hypothetical protein